MRQLTSKYKIGKTFARRKLKNMLMLWLFYYIIYSFIIFFDNFVIFKIITAGHLVTIFYPCPYFFILTLLCWSYDLDLLYLLFITLFLDSIAILYFIFL